MAASMLQRRVRRLQCPPLLATRLQSLVTSRQPPQTQFYSSTVKSRGFSDVLRFATIQPADGQLTPQDFRFKAALVVNTASKCSHAGQLKQLQTLHEKYSEQGLVVVAVPSNDFAGQEPGASDEMLKRYAEFGVTFFIADKTPVTGSMAHPFFKKIADKYSTSVAPTWNFDKFLVSHRGDMRAVFPNDTEPLLAEVIAEIEEVLEDLPRGLEPGQELVEDEEYDYAEGDSDSDEEDSDDDGK
ncbi:glutathione peroxidase gpx1 [Phytophthora pseudosyringae]|uniref:Glutathione peroxidase gpx1 n=1 Tax=Phytophthora pseudosyringae TaxID=221518 RepID=A0A8T1V2K7_9STRA|nr:glutathione peroxidase gpx1 [Phytophthora pseudosyringae]